MLNSKLIKSLKKLDENELESLQAFVQSPYFNKSIPLSRFFDLILASNILKGGEIDKNEILNQIYPGMPVQKRWLPDLMYGLMLLLENFLAEEKYRQSTFQQKINLMMQAYQKDLEPMINGIEKDLELVHNMTEVRDSNYLYESFMIHSERDFSFRLLGKISDNNSLQIKSDQLDLFYLATKLKDACEMLNRSRIMSVHYDLKMLNVIVPYLQEHPDLFNNLPAIQIYLSIYLMLTTEDHEKHYFELKHLVGANEKTFLPDELRTIYGYAQNYCIRRLNQGNTEYVKQLFEILKLLYNNKLILEANQNIQWDFKNFVSISLRLKEYEFAYEMINAFKEYLPEHIRDNAYTYNLAYYYYESGEYKKATKLLHSVEFSDIYYSLDSKVMLLKIYYQLEEEESFFALISSFGIFLRRNSLISKENAEVYSNFVRFAKKAFLLKTKLPYQKKKRYYDNVSLLKKTVEETRKIANINWLLDEINALTNSASLN